MSPVPSIRRTATTGWIAISLLALATVASAGITVTPAPVAAEPQQIDGFTVREGYDQVGHTYSDQTAANVEACMQLCRDDSRCLAFTFEVKREVCHLKDTPNLMRPAPGKVTGSRSK